MFKYSKLDNLISTIEQGKTLIVLKGYTIDKKIDLQYIFNTLIISIQNDYYHYFMLFLHNYLCLFILTHFFFLKK